MKYIFLMLLSLTSNLSILSATPDGNSLNGSEWVNLKEGEEIGRYFRRGGVIHVHVNGMLTEELMNADSASFRANKTFSEFGRDKGHIWFIGTELGADKTSWKVISQSYSKDHSTVYCGAQELPGADPMTFTILEEGFAEWGADEAAVYSQWFRLENSDPETFKFIDDTFSKDEKSVYYFQHRLDRADPLTFEVIRGQVAKDKNAIFAFGSRMPDYIDIPTVQIPGDGYIYDKNGRYHLRQGEWIKTEGSWGIMEQLKSIF